MEVVVIIFKIISKYFIPIDLLKAIISIRRFLLQARTNHFIKWLIKRLKVCCTELHEMGLKFLHALRRSDSAEIALAKLRALIRRSEMRTEREDGQVHQ